MVSTADIIVFITQDIDIRNEDWLEKLVEPIIDGEAEACFSRQLTKYDNIEKYTREKNYPAESYINTKEDIIQNQFIPYAIVNYINYREC